MVAPATAYTELHAHSFYSFGLGASYLHELLTRARELGHTALALTDNNLCGALEFARTAKTLDIQPITGGDITLSDGSHLTLLAQTRKGYANLSRLFTLANRVDRRKPALDGRLLADHAEGLILLTGSRNGRISILASEGRMVEAEATLRQYMEWFGSGNVYLELTRNIVHGDTRRIRGLVGLGRELGVKVVTTNAVDYHIPERYQLHTALVAVGNNTTLDQAIHLITTSGEAYLKPACDMARLFCHIPEAVANTMHVVERCSFSLASDLGYQLPAPAVPEGYTSESYFERLCYEAAQRRYGTVTEKVRVRLGEEFRLIRKHKLAGFLLLYREVIHLAHQLMIEAGIVRPETPMEMRPPGRGRGSSVALLTGYLIGISHVDPLVYGLPLERFLPEDMRMLPDIDLDLPRSLRDKLIERIHQHFGPEFAVLTGAITSYQAKGAIADLGKALGLPKEDLRRLSKKLHSHDAANLKAEMMEMEDFKDKVDSPGWRELLHLAPQLMGAPKALGQHVGGMILSSSPVPEMVPVRTGAIDGRFIMDWNKDSVADAGFAKIDVLSLPVLDQLDEALDLIESRTGTRPDLSQIRPDDEAVYDMINQGKAKGVFLLQSPAQLKMGQRLRSRNLVDLAYQVALIRPGVGVQGSTVSQFVERYRHGVAWDYDHPLEERALERGCGIIVWQEQVVQLLMDVGGMSAAEADEVRRAFAKPNNAHLITIYWERFRDGAKARGVDVETAKKIFSKVNGHYMFPESHSYAFGITAYQTAWLKCHHPLEFFVTLMNNQPMGFYPLEALKQDARRHGVRFLNPDVNLSHSRCNAEGDAVRVGLEFVKDVGGKVARAVIAERERGGPFAGVGDFVRRVGAKPQAVESLVLAGAFDSLNRHRKAALWEANLYVRPKSHQQVLPLPMDDVVPELDDFSDYEKMLFEYRVMGIYPKGHLMEFLRPSLPRQVMRTAEVEEAKEGQEVVVAGWAIARQHPRGESGTVFVTVEDETGDVQLILWPKVFTQFRRALRNPVLSVRGKVSRWDGTTNVIVTEVKPVKVPAELPRAHDWH